MIGGLVGRVLIPLHRFFSWSLLIGVVAGVATTVGWTLYPPISINTANITSDFVLFLVLIFNSTVIALCVHVVSGIGCVGDACSIV